MDARGKVSTCSFSESDEASSDDESLDFAYFEKIVPKEWDVSETDARHGGLKTRSSCRLQDKRLQTSPSNLNDVPSSTLQRLPTRRPDPNTFNRNALMARENRRKKKEYLTKLEEEVEDYRVENKKLRKILKHQFRKIETLNHERNYLKNVLANQSQISSLVNILKAGAPNSKISGCSSKSSASSASQDLRTVGMSTDEDPLMAEPDVYNDSIFADFDIDDTLLPKGVDDFLNYIPDQGELSLHANLMDHNYISEGRGDAGVCLHVCGNEFSVEFCVKCNDNAKSSWLE